MNPCVNDHRSRFITEASGVYRFGTAIRRTAAPPQSIMSRSLCWAFALPFLTTILMPAAVVSQDLFTWSAPRVLVPGKKCDVIASKDGVLHLITAKYYQFDADGNEVTVKSPGDNCQGGRDDGPSIDIGPDNKVYELTKSGGGHTHQIFFRLRSPDGTVERELKASDGLRDNRTMAVWAGKNGEAYWMHSNNVGWPNPPDHYDVNHIDAGGNTTLGDLIFNSTQIDFVCDAARSGTILGAAMGGKSECSYTWADIAEGDVLDQMKENRVSHKATAQPGWPALYTDRNGDIHLAYGGSGQSRPEKGKIFYNRYRNGREKVFDNDVLVLDGWPHRGVPALASSDDGRNIVCVGVAGPHEQGWENNAVLIWSYSTDAGRTWSPKDTIDNTKVDTDEGFRRPRMTAVGNRVFLFFNQKHDNNISLAVMDVGDMSSRTIIHRSFVAPSPQRHTALMVNLLGQRIRDIGMPVVPCCVAVQAQGQRESRNTVLLNQNQVHR